MALRKGIVKVSGVVLKSNFKGQAQRIIEPRWELGGRG